MDLYVLLLRKELFILILQLLSGDRIQLVIIRIMYLYTVK